MCVCARMHTHAHEVQKKVWDLLDLELRVAVSYLKWMLGTELRSPYKNSTCS